MGAPHPLTGARGKRTSAACLFLTSLTQLARSGELSQLKLEHRERNILTVLLPHPSFGIVYFLSFFLTHSHKKSNPEPTTHNHRQSRIYSLTHTGEGIHHIIITKEQDGTPPQPENSLLTVQVRTYDAASVS